MKGKHILWAGLALLLLSVLAGAFSQVLVEDILRIERPFGEEPLSIQIARYALGTAAIGFALMLYGGWRNKRGK
jgi:H+/Cl- antiporter ClcA